MGTKVTAEGGVNALKAHQSATYPVWVCHKQRLLRVM